ncbi:MAG: hypothetical protein K8L99_24555 [Anaerolineae bacterium]|nr:hypothetical protein [Anaerolineae bacterium]
MTDYASSASIQEEVLAFLLSAPTPQRIIDFQASDAAQERLRDLLEANRQGTLSSEEQAELEEASQMNHFVMMLKAKAHKALQGT